MKHLLIDPRKHEAPTRDHAQFPESLPQAKETQVHPTNAGAENASLYFVGTATTILEWEGIRVMTDPNFLHKGDHVHLGPGVTAQRLTDPAMDLHELPRIDMILLSHYHEDHFDRKVEDSLRRDLPIISTPHAKSHLSNKSDGESFTNVTDLNFFETCLVDIATPDDKATRLPAIKVTGMPGKHVPPGILNTLNDLAGAVPPTNGWMVELGYTKTPPADFGDNLFESGYRIYISGDTLMVDELKEIPERYKDKNIDLMLIHLGGTSIPSAKMPLLMVTMDAKQGIELMQLIQPDVTIPIHYDDYDVFLSPLTDFKKAVEEAGLTSRVVYLDRKDQYKFNVKKANPDQ